MSFIYAYYLCNASIYINYSLLFITCTKLLYFYYLWWFLMSLCFHGECFFYHGFRSFVILCPISHLVFLFFFCALLFLPLSTRKQACRERIKGLQSKITAFSQRMNLINQRGTPDSEEMTS